MAELSQRLSRHETEVCHGGGADAAAAASSDSAEAAWSDAARAACDQNAAEDRTSRAGLNFATASGSAAGAVTEPGDVLLRGREGLLSQHVGALGLGNSRLGVVARISDGLLKMPPRLG